MQAFYWVLLCLEQLPPMVPIGRCQVTLLSTTSYRFIPFLGGIVVTILHHVGQVHDGCIFVAMRLFGEKAAWVDQAHDTEYLHLLYMIIGLTLHEKQTSCT